MPVNRKLVAVVVADVVGYSRLMERDEAGTHERLRALTRDLFTPKVAEHGGRTVKTSGDGMLLEFPSATSALRCAVEIQREMGARNLYVAADEKIELRIGINLGDIIVEGDDILGDGVNVAARLETLAEPGGICVASAIWEQVHEDLGIDFVDAGEQQVKNIAKPIRMFRVALGKGARPSDDSALSAVADGTPATRRFAIRRTAITVGGLAALALVVAVGWHVTQRTDAPPGGAAATDARTPASLMIVPFRAPAADPALSALADLLTDDLTRAIADRHRGVRIIGREAAAAYKGVAIDPRAIGREVNVRLLLEGDVAVSGEDVAVTMRLVDAASASQIASDRKTVARSRLAEEQAALATQLTFAAGDMFETAESRRIASIPQSAATAQDLVWRAGDVADRGDLVAVREAKKLYDEAIRRDASLSRAWSGRAVAATSEFGLDYLADRERLLADADRDSQRAVALDDRDPDAWYVRAIVLTYTARHAAAFDAIDRAQALDPTRFFLFRGYLLVGAGRAADALAVVETRRSLMGTMDPRFRRLACHAHLHLGHYEQAIAECERASVNVDDYWLYLDLAAAYAQVGDGAKAAAAKAQLLKRVPEFTIARYEAKKFSDNAIWLQELRTHILSGLRKAGVPE